MCCVYFKLKFHHLIHYPIFQFPMVMQLMRKIGQLINMWSMRFKAKHKESKTAAVAIANRKNICYSWLLKNHLKILHQSYNKTNFDFSILCDVGKVLNISSAMKENISIALKNFNICKSLFIS